MQDFEKLGVFYLGKRFDPQAGKPTDDLILYDSKDLLTHAVCVGMTGSGKTGLCLSILEELIIDGIPALVIDPKGDIGNVMLTFPDLSGADFAPWVDADAASRAGMTVQDFAQKQAETWMKGLADWGQDGDRIRRLRAAADITIYTPGGTAGRPLSVVRSFSRPNEKTFADPEALTDCLNASVDSLLALIGVEGEPLQSREHILLASIISAAWTEGTDLDLAGLVARIQNPPIQRVGVMDIESFFPAKDRFALAVRINNLLAAPGFSAWLQGDPIDVGELLHGPDGKPRVAIISIAHLSDSERMSVVTLVLSQMLAWMRSQPGATSLRAALYMDEIFGYFPPVANPPSKAPLLTLLKQARAFGLGVILATQNPVDLDYKGLANAGTWFIGRLQTERDKARLLDGLQGAMAAGGKNCDRAALDRLLSGLVGRVFLMNNVHDNEPTLFQVRWTMSYLRGPLTRDQIRALTPPAAASRQPSATPTAPASSTSLDGLSKEPPVLPPAIPVVYLAPSGAPATASGLVYEPMLIGRGKVHFTDKKAAVDETHEVTYLARFADDGAVDWDSATSCGEAPDCVTAPVAGASFAPAPAVAANSRNYASWRKALAAALARREKIELLQSTMFGLLSRAGESEREFRIRLSQSARERIDAEKERLRAKYAPKLDRLNERLRKAEQALEREQEQAGQARLQSWISIGASVLGAFLGRKTISASTITRAGTAARGVGRASKQARDADRASENLDTLKAQHDELDAAFQAELAEVAARFDPATEKLEPAPISPKKSDIEVSLVALAWSPRS